MARFFPRIDKKTHTHTHARTDAAAHTFAHTALYTCKVFKLTVGGLDVGHPQL